MNKIIYILLFFAVTIAFSQEDTTRGYRVKVGEMCPDLNFKLMDGTPVSNESLKGKVVVLQFTASWCVVCRKEMPHLEKEVWQRFKNDDFVLIGIDLKEDAEKVKRFIKDMQVSYPFTIDVDGAMFESFTLPKAGVTRNIVLNKNGKIIFLSRLYEAKEFNHMIEVISAELNKV